MDGKMISFKSPNLILAGFGALERLGEEATALDAKKALLVTDKGVVEAGIAGKVQAILEKEGIQVDIFDKVMADPGVDCAEACVEMAKGNGYDLMVGVGGGSSMDIASVTSVMCTNPGSVFDYLGINLVKKPGIPTILIPTTAGTGAEATPNAVLTDTRDNLKKAVVSQYILPRVGIVDPYLMVSMPPAVTSFTGMDALTHAVEAYTANNANIMTDLFAREAIRLTAQSLRTAAARGDNLEARYDMAIASLYGGIALAGAGVTAVHALAYPPGGEYNVPHGIANGLLLPHVMAFNVPGNVRKFAEIATLLGEKVGHLPLLEQAYRSAQAVKALLKDLPMPQSFTEMNVPREAIPKMAETTITIARLMANNPRVMTAEDAAKIYESAM